MQERQRQAQTSDCGPKCVELKGTPPCSVVEPSTPWRFGEPRVVLSFAVEVFGASEDGARVIPIDEDLEDDP